MNKFEKKAMAKRAYKALVKMGGGNSNFDRLNALQDEQNFNNWAAGEIDLANKRLSEAEELERYYPMLGYPQSSPSYLEFIGQPQVYGAKKPELIAANRASARNHFLAPIEMRGKLLNRPTQEQQLQKFYDRYGKPAPLNPNASINKPMQPTKHETYPD